jgi:hypothetical protein
MRKQKRAAFLSPEQQHRDPPPGCGPAGNTEDMGAESSSFKPACK